MDHRERRDSKGSDQSFIALKDRSEENMKDSMQITGRYERRSRYSMNYQSYEATRIQPAEQTRRMLDYMFPGYQKRDPRNWYEKMTQTDLDGMDVYSLIGTELIEGEPIYNTRFSSLKMEDDDDESPEEHELLVHKKSHRPSVVTRGWEGPPIRILGKSSQEGFHLEVDDQYHQPQTILVPREVIESQELKMDVVPDEQGIPKVVIYLGKKHDVEGESKDGSLEETVVIYDGRADFDSESEDTESPRNSIENIEPESPPLQEEPRIKRQLHFEDQEEPLESMQTVRNSLEIVSNVRLIPVEETPVEGESSSNDTVEIPQVTAARNSRLIEPIRSTGSHLDVWESVIPDLNNNSEQLGPDLEAQREGRATPLQESSPYEVTSSMQLATPESEHSVKPGPEMTLEHSPTPETLPVLQQEQSPPKPKPIQLSTPEPVEVPQQETIVIPLPTPEQTTVLLPKQPQVEEPKPIKKQLHSSDPSDKLFSPLDNYPLNMDEDRADLVHSSEQEPTLNESPETDHPLTLTEDYPSRYSFTSVTSRTPTTSLQRPSEVSNWLEDNILSNAKNLGKTKRGSRKESSQQDKTLPTVEEEKDGPLKVLDDYPSSFYSRTPKSSKSTEGSKRSFELNSRSDPTKTVQKPPVSERTPHLVEENKQEILPNEAAAMQFQNQPSPDESVVNKWLENTIIIPAEETARSANDQLVDKWLDNQIIQPAVKSRTADENYKKSSSKQPTSNNCNEQVAEPSSKTVDNWINDEIISKADPRTSRRGLPPTQPGQEESVSDRESLDGKVEEWVADEIIQPAQVDGWVVKNILQPVISKKAPTGTDGIKNALFEPSKPLTMQTVQQRDSLDEEEITSWLADEIITPAEKKRQKLSSTQKPLHPRISDQKECDTLKESAPIAWVDKAVLKPAESRPGVENNISGDQNKKNPLQSGSPELKEGNKLQGEQSPEAIDSQGKDQQKPLTDREETFHWLDKSQENNPFRPHFDSPYEDTVHEEVYPVTSASAAGITEQGEKDIPTEHVENTDKQISPPIAATDVQNVLHDPPPQQQFTLADQPISEQVMKGRSPETSMGSFGAKALKQPQPEDSSLPFISSLIESGKRLDERRRSSLLAKKAIENGNYLIRDDEKDYIKKDKERPSDDLCRSTNSIGVDLYKIRDGKSDAQEKRQSLLEKIFPTCFKRRKSSLDWPRSRSPSPAIPQQRLEEKAVEMHPEIRKEGRPGVEQSHPGHHEVLNAIHPQVDCSRRVRESGTEETSLIEEDPTLKRGDIKAPSVIQEASRLVLPEQLSVEPEPQESTELLPVTEPTPQGKPTQHMAEIPDFPEAIETRRYPIFPDYMEAQKRRQENEVKVRPTPLPPRRGFPQFPDYGEIISPKENKLGQGPSTTVQSTASSKKSNVGSDDENKRESLQSELKAARSQPLIDSTEYQEHPWPSQASSYIPSVKSEDVISHAPKSPSKEKEEKPRKGLTYESREPVEIMKSKETKGRDQQPSHSKGRQYKGPDPPGNGVPLFADFYETDRRQGSIKSQNAQYEHVPREAIPPQRQHMAFDPPHMRRQSKNRTSELKRRESSPTLTRHSYSAPETTLEQILENLTCPQPAQAPKIVEVDQQIRRQSTLSHHTSSAPKSPRTDMMNNLSHSQPSAAPSELPQHLNMEQRPGIYTQHQPQTMEYLPRQQPAEEINHIPTAKADHQTAATGLPKQTQPAQKPAAPGHGIPRFKDYSDYTPKQPPLMTGDHVHKETYASPAKSKIVTAAEKKAEIEKEMLPITRQMENLKRQMYMLTPKSRPMRTGPEYGHRQLPTSMEIYKELERRTMTATKPDREAIMTERRKRQYEENARRKIRRAIERSKQS